MDSIYAIEFDQLGIDVSKEELNNGILNPNKPIHSILYDQSIDENTQQFNLETYTTIRNNILSSLNNPNAKSGLAESVRLMRRMRIYQSKSVNANCCPK